MILNALYLGTSEATLLWGGLDVSETNFLGRGMMIGGGVVASTTPTVPEAEAGRALTLRAAGPRRRDGLLLAGSFLYSDGSEFFQAYGPDDVDPTKWRALNTQRVGGTFTVGGELSRTARFSTDGRFERSTPACPASARAIWAAAQARPIDFMIHEGNSRAGLPERHAGLRHPIRPGAALARPPAGRCRSRRRCRCWGRATASPRVWPRARSTFPASAST